MQAVALLAEGVDRNRAAIMYNYLDIVALLAEGVDRNTPTSLRTLRRPAVALLAEGVDRNWRNSPQLAHQIQLPSSRRAWIEILPRKRRCDRLAMSPSSRRAWIEMAMMRATSAARMCRPPRGGRG